MPSGHPSFDHQRFREGNHLAQGRWPSGSISSERRAAYSALTAVTHALRDR